MRTLFEPYSDEYLQAWVMTDFLYAYMDNTKPNVKQIQTGLRHFLNEQRKLGKTGLLNELPTDFLAFVQSDAPTLEAYQAAVPAWASYVTKRFCPDVNGLGNVYTFFSLPLTTFSDPVKQRTYGSLALWTAGFIATTIVADKHLADQSILAGVSLVSIMLLAAYWHHISKDKITGPVEAMKKAPLDTSCKFNQTNGATNHSWSWFSSSSSVDYAALRKSLERHVGGSPSLLK